MSAARSAPSALSGYQTHTSIAHTTKFHTNNMRRGCGVGQPLTTHSAVQQCPWCAMAADKAEGPQAVALWPALSNHIVPKFGHCLRLENACCMRQHTNNPTKLPTSACRGREDISIAAIQLAKSTPRGASQADW